MDAINNPHDVYFRERFTRREIAQNFLRWHLPAELLAFVDLDSLEISKDSLGVQGVAGLVFGSCLPVAPASLRSGWFQASRPTPARFRTACLVC
jgi:hypothetical protein